MSKEKIAKVSKLMTEAIQYQPTIWSHMPYAEYDHDAVPSQTWISGSSVCKICHRQIEPSGLKNIEKELRSLSSTMTPIERNEAIEQFFNTLEKRN